MLKRLLLVALLAVAPAAVADDEPVVLVLGDSLSAAYGIADPGDGWVALLQNRLAEQGHPHRVVNRSVSGDTTRQAVRRLPDALAEHDPAVLILQLGGNDGLRGLPPREPREHLARMIEAGQGAGARVLLVGVRLPPNYGRAYTERFTAVYEELAERYGVALVPSILDGIALDDGLMQDDRIHPNAAAQPEILDNIWHELEPLLE